jgi:hypothetical protein
MNHDDERQLQLLSRLHYVGAVLAGVIPVCGALYGAFGVAILLGRLPGRVPGPGLAIGWLPLGMGLFVLLVGVTAVALNLVCARSLRERKQHSLFLLISAMNCVHFPLGTLLGTFTLIVLCRPEVRAAFTPPSGSLPPNTQPRAGGTHYPTSHLTSGADSR